MPDGDQLNHCFKVGTFLIDFLITNTSCGLIANTEGFSSVKALKGFSHSERINDTKFCTVKILNLLQYLI